MRKAKSYSIVDHQLLHGGYFHKLSHQALALYLFLLVVGDREGRSYYSERTITSILRLDRASFTKARSEIIRENLVRYSPPYFWVQNIGSQYGHRRTQKTDPIPCGRKEAFVSPDTERDWDWQKSRVKDLLRQLSAASA